MLEVLEANERKKKKNQKIPPVNVTGGRLKV